MRCKAGAKGVKRLKLMLKLMLTAKCTGQGIARCTNNGTAESTATGTDKETDRSPL